MKENEDKNEELQSRRDFFKQVAKSVLPILGGIALFGFPVNGLSASESPEEGEGEDTEMGCNYGCSGVCKGSCGRECSFGCTNSCSGSCSGACKGSCYGNCKGGCGGSGGWY